MGLGDLFHLLQNFEGPQMKSIILYSIVSRSSISLNIFSPATRYSKQRNYYVTVKHIWQGFTAHCLVAGHILYTGKRSSCFPIALV